MKEKLEKLADDVFQYDEKGNDVMTPMKYCGIDHSPEDYEGIEIKFEGLGDKDYE